MAANKSSAPRNYSLAWDENEAFGISSDMRRTQNSALSEQERKETLYDTYVSNVWISACIDVIAKRITSGGWEIEPIVQGKGNKKNVAKLKALFAYVNDDEDCLQLLRAIITDLLIYGEAYIEVLQKGGVPYQLHKIDCQTITYELDPHGQVTGYTQRLRSSQDEIHFEPEEIIRWWLPSPRASKVGLSPIERILNPVYADQSMAGWVNTFFKKGARPPFWIEFPGSEKEAARFVQWMRENYTGAHNAHVPMVLYSGATLKEVGRGAVDVDFKAGRSIARDEILAGYGVPLSMIGIQETAHLGSGSGESAAKVMQLNTCDPIKQIILEKINYRIVNIGFNVQDYVFATRYGDFRSDLDIVKIQDTQIKNGLSTPNEERQSTGKQPYTGYGDTPIIVAGKEILALQTLEDIADNARATNEVDLATKKVQLQAQQKQLEAPAAPPPNQANQGQAPHPLSRQGPPQNAKESATLLHWQDTDDAVQKLLKELKSQGVQTITWEAGKGACEECLENDKQTVKAGSRFRNGSYLPPEHDHCECAWIDNTGKKYAWTGVDGDYKQLKASEEGE